MITPIVNEDEWRLRLAGLPQWSPPLVPTFVIAPHPDDETLGAGGLIATLRAAGVEVTVIAVTDGEFAYGETPGMAQMREQEQIAALCQLGVDSQHVRRLRLPDRDVAAHEGELVETLARLIPSNGHLIAPWPQDFHPDHEASGRAAETVAGQKSLSVTWYLFWAWHRGTIDLLDTVSPTSFPLSPAALQAKWRALLCHESQLQHATEAPILPDNLLGPVRRPFEVFLPVNTGSRR